MDDRTIMRRQETQQMMGASFKRGKQSALLKLGSEKRPLVLQVQSEERKSELEALCKENEWHCVIDVDAEADENITDLDALQNPVQPIRVEKEIGRNDPCHCGSGKKYKSCHGRTR